MRCFTGHKVQNRSGFTLMEVLVAMAVMAIALIGFFTLFSQTVALEESAKFNTIAPMLAQEKMAQLRSGVFGDSYGLSGESLAYPGYSWSISVEDVADNILSGDATEGLKKVDVTVALNGGERSYSLRSYEWLPK
ncbi:MAG: hypothetical protein B5M56_01600 [Desulfococcus sp. 4484_241]|nr:MAG: hypothetical protein B5M56_01600 [Desulfococcus sp. 4484_241]